MPPETDYLGTAAVARLLFVSPRTVHRLAKAGALTPAAVAPGGKAGSFLFRTEDVERFKAEREAAA